MIRIRAESCVYTDEMKFMFFRLQYFVFTIKDN